MIPKITKVASFILLVVYISSCGPVIPITGERSVVHEKSPENNSAIGTVLNIRTQVHAGAKDNLKLIEGKSDLGNDDFVSVRDGGKARLEFPGPISLLLFNQSDMDGIKLEYDAQSNPRIVNRLIRGGFSGEVKSGNQLTVDLAFGVKVNVLGTRFFIIYDEESGYIIIGKFDGTLIVSVPGQPDINLRDSEMVDIASDGTVRHYSPIVFTAPQFDRMADQCNSAFQGVNILRRDNGLPLPGRIIVDKNQELPCGTSPQGIMAATSAPVVELDYCYKSDQDICVFGLGMVKQNMMITLKVDRPNVSDLYILIEGEKRYPCKEISNSQSKYYCVGDPVQVEVYLTVQVFQQDDQLLAQGELLFPFLVIRPTRRPQSKYP